VIASTGFTPPRRTTPPMSDQAKALAEAARPFYEALARHAL
jgi:hypothetical protein